VKILYLAHRIPYPPNKGDKIRSFHEIEYLSREHELHLVAFCDRREDLRYAKRLEDYCGSVTLVPTNRFIQTVRAAASMIAGGPFTLGYFSSRGMKRAVSSQLSRHHFDLIFVYCSSMAPYVEGLSTIPKILDFVDSDACKWAQYSGVKKRPMKWVYGLEGDRLKRYESRMIDTFDFSVFVSPREADHLPKRQKHKLLFIQNGIDLDFYQPETRPEKSRDIIFTGVMDYLPNVDAVTYFARDVFPLIRSRFPESRFLIVGSNPVAEVRKLAELPGVIVTGTVPDVRPFVAQARVAVAPLRISQGIQNKILQALAAGLPVVASPNAAAALANLTRFPLTIANSPMAFATAVADYLDQPPMSDRNVEVCRQYLKEHYDWTKNLAALRTALNGLVPQSAKSWPEVSSSVMVADGAGSLQ